MHFITWPSEQPFTYWNAWQKAALRTSQADPFGSTPTWQLAFHEAFNPSRSLLLEEEGGNVLAFAEHVSDQGKVCLTPVEAHWFFGCPLLGKGAVDLLGANLEKLQKIYAPAFPYIFISGIRPAGSLAGRLKRAFGRHFNIYLYASGVQCAASLAGGLDGFLSRRSGNRRAKLKKARRLAALAGLEFERHVPASAAEAEQVYRRMLAVELHSWKGRGHCGMAEPPAREFYAVLLRRLAERRLGRVIFARHEDRDIGFIFGGLAGKIYRGQQFSYDQAWKKFSVGSLMQLEQISWLCAEGVRRYDMGPLSGPRMEYKAHWTEKNSEVQTWVLVKG